MNTGNDSQFLEQVKRRLDTHADSVDELTAARLGAARRRALERAEHRPRRWLPVAGLATAAAALLAVLLLMQPAQQVDTDWEMWVAQDEFEVIEELDFYAWLEETQPNG